MAYTESEESLKDEHDRLLSLCPKGWAWLVGDCDFAPDWGGCEYCQEALAPILVQSSDESGDKNE